MAQTDTELRKNGSSHWSRYLDILTFPADVMTATISDLLVNQARALVLGALGRIKLGQVVIQDDTTDETLVMGSPTRLSVRLQIKNNNVWRRVVLNGSIGFAEAYFLGEADCAELETFLEIMVINRDHMADMNNPVSSFKSIAAGWLRPSNTLSTSRGNVKAHYDISNDVFAAFLSPDMTYSCPIWPQAPIKGEESNNTLENAQMNKLREVIKQAKLKATDHVLEIGTGWGGFAIEAVKQTGCRVTSITLSEEQKKEAESRIAAAGFADKITVLLKDYREMPQEGLIFDKVVSIEMIEHVGKNHMEDYFRIIHKLLKMDGGIAVFQSSTMPETRQLSYDKGNDYIREYIFPGAYVPTVSTIFESAHKGSNGSFVPDYFINLGGHYSRCLREWRESFVRNFDKLISPALKEKNPGITPEAIEQFKRKYVFYFAYCEAGFKTKTLGNLLLTLAREGAVETLEHIEL